MVIPTTTTLTEANHENVLLGTDGKVSINDIKHPTDKVIVSYTVDLSNGNLTDGTNTINAMQTQKRVHRGSIEQRNNLKHSGKD